MHVEQISVFLENKAGRIAEVTSILAEADVNIRAISIADTSDFGVLRLIVDNNKAAEEALKKHSLTVRKNKVLAVEVNDKPGGLHKIMDLISNVDLNIEYMYAVVQQSRNNAVMIFRFDDTDDATKLLEDNSVTMIDQAQLSAL